MVLAAEQQAGELAGGIILGVALWLRHDSQTTNILYLQLGDKQAPNTFYVGTGHGFYNPAGTSYATLMPKQDGMTGALLTETKPKTTVGVIVPVCQE
ncbi:hypothetical protein DV515_00002443 [Chloebia gouldiae]|uniref:Uncharacterized protein n=1 Tax=Chloebia gouldiae TaxID=44316 RepID=A0A3L8SWE7_CHLGU|nr:hypothetical protein DV515_00002443 [Chloebia gouldiae]